MVTLDYARGLHSMTGVLIRGEEPQRHTEGEGSHVAREADAATRDACSPRSWKKQEGPTPTPTPTPAPSEGARPYPHLLSDFWPLTKLLLMKLPSLWSSVSAAPGHQCCLRSTGCPSQETRVTTATETRRQRVRAGLGRRQRGFTSLRP